MDYYQNEWNAINFTSIDFETANEQSNSPCSIGLVIVENGNIVSSLSFLIKPPYSTFNQINKTINKITEIDVLDAPEFPLIYPQIRRFIEKKIIIAHNASFDIRVLKDTLTYYKIPSPEFKYACSIKLAQTAFPQIGKYDLSTVANHLGLNFLHHDAMEDARICAEIAIRAIKTDTDFSISFQTEELTRLERNKQRSFSPGNKSLTNIYQNKKIPSKFLEPNLSTEYTSSIFYGKKIVFTGDLQSLSRIEAAARVQSLGGDIDTCISQRTNYVIIGNNPGPSKLNKVESLINQGFTITILSESDFLNEINQVEVPEFRSELIVDKGKSNDEKIIIETIVSENLKSEKLKGMTFVVSGTFEKLSRDEIKKEIEAHGGKNAGSISSKTSYVLAGENMGPEKRKKAQSLNIPVISESDFLQMTEDKRTSGQAD